MDLVAVAASEFESEVECAADDEADGGSGECGAGDDDGLGFGSSRVVSDDGRKVKRLHPLTASDMEELQETGYREDCFCCRTFKKFDVLSSLTKSAPDFCSVYVITKGKVISVRSAQRPLANTAAPPKLTDSYGLPHQLSADHASLDGGVRFGSQLGEDQLGS
ncbi:hypothetical protein Droror1_Dr00027484 [Drosera rotundifolia]